MKWMMPKWLCFVFLLISYTKVQGQEEQVKPAFFIEPEAFYAVVVPNYSGAPKAGNAYAGSLSLGWQSKKDKSWQAYYGFPQTGIQLSYMHLQNRKELGSQYAINPFVMFNHPFGKKHSLDFKLGLGMAYHTKPFDAVSNPKNLAIGSPLTWFFNSTASYRFAVSKRIHIKVNGGFWHASNGHTTLPNFGQNYGVFGLGIQYYPEEGNEFTKYERTPAERKKYFFLRTTFGMGLQEYGGTRGPINMGKHYVTSSALAFGVLFRKHLLVKAGIGYQYYSAYATAQKNNEFVAFQGGETKAASNIFLFLGTELLLGHVSMDIQGGLNLWKPYFTHFYDKYEPRGKFDKTMKVLFSTRVGVNVYALNTAKNPKHNVSIGAFLNANYGQADYTSFLLNYSVRLND